MLETRLTQREYRRELIELAQDLLGEAILLDGLLGYFERENPWKGRVWDELLRAVKSRSDNMAKDLMQVMGFLVEEAFSSPPTAPLGASSRR